MGGWSLALVAMGAVGGLTGCQAVFGLAPPPEATAPWLDSAHVARKRLAITPPTTDGLDDFPAGIVIDADPELVARALAGARDVVITADDGTTVLDHEIEGFDTATGALVAWVRVPRLAGVTHLYLYYGGAPGSASTATWSSRYGAVWHLAGATPEPDSTANGNALSAPASQPAVIAGVAGRARSFDGVVDELVAPHADSLDAGSGSLAVSLWVHVTSVLPGGYDSPLAKGGSTAVRAGYAVQLGSGAWTASISDGSVQRQATFGLDAQLSGRWLHLAAVVDRDGDELRAIVDGVVRDRVPLAPLGSCASPTNSLALSGGLDRYAGAIDEVRLYRGAPPAAWYATEFANLTDPAFLTVGVEEARPGG